MSLTENQVRRDDADAAVGAVRESGTRLDAIGVEMFISPLHATEL